ncbi:hypothetical protein TWF103_009938 [Orbilia oligospora]|nr:hypothetical protein TWF103_009938 [Orbilia oligospora]
MSLAEYSCNHAPLTSYNLPMTYLYLEALGTNKYNLILTLTLTYPYAPQLNRPLSAVDVCKLFETLKIHILRISGGARPTDTAHPTGTVQFF